MKQNIQKKIRDKKKGKIRENKKEKSRNLIVKLNFTETITKIYQNI